jgi:hypothetical protein
MVYSRHSGLRGEGVFVFKAGKYEGLMVIGLLRGREGVEVVWKELGSFVNRWRAAVRGRIYFLSNKFVPVLLDCYARSGQLLPLF